MEEVKNEKGLARRPQWDQHRCHSTGMRYEQAWKEHSDAQFERIRNSQSSKDSTVLKIFGVEEGRSGGQRRFQNQRIPKGNLRLAAALDGQQDQRRINLDYIGKAARSWTARNAAYGSSVAASFFVTDT